MQTTRRSLRLCSTSLLLAALPGCHSAQPAGSNLPTTSPQSVALPGAVNSADAPKAPSVVESRAADLVQYQDPAHGVTFDYPSLWRPPQQGTSGAALAQPDFAQVAPKPVITQMFTPAGTYYADTVLGSLSFSYTVVPHSTAAACAQLPGKALQSPASRSVSYQGIPYTEATGGDAGMCHHLQATVDATFQGSSCYLFERDTVTTCPDTQSEKKPRPLTSQEQAALQRHLDAIMQSVRIGRPAR